jgi:hypothetical protein
MNALMLSHHDQHTTDIAGLAGARAVSAIETGKGRTWDEAKIMLLTGGDMLTARFMRQDNFDFVPQFKLTVAGNHKPGLRSTARPAVQRQAEGRVAGRAGMDDSRLPGVAAQRAGAARGGDRGDRSSATRRNAAKCSADWR